MCGIAGLSCAEGVEVDLTATARLLVAGLAERGQDATGYAYHRPDGLVEVEKDSMRLAAFIERLHVPAGVRGTIMHVRDFTKGRPGLNDNNHPIRYGRVVGVHNGHIDNDDELFEEWQKPRSTPLITVDSEAIMMLADTLGDAGQALEHVRGSAAIALLRDGEPDRLTIAKRASRTLWLARGDGLALFASTPEPLELARRATGRRLRFEEVRDGSVIELRDGEVTGRSHFWVDRRHVGRRTVEYPAIPEKPELVRRALSAFTTGRTAPAHP
jgi:glucosamine 6-phosphate synthetase-like amidotransferase/phosphosugar isomerase protein